LEPVITKWGTWIDAKIYYYDNFQVVKNIVDSMRTQDARATEAAQEQLNEYEVK
jgi:hypothetical protein